MFLILVAWRDLNDWPVNKFWVLFQQLRRLNNSKAFNIGLSSIERLKQFISWQQDCVIIVGLWTEYKPIFENWWWEIINWFIVNVILSIILSLSFRILPFLWWIWVTIPGLIIYNSQSFFLCSNNS